MAKIAVKQSPTRRDILSIWVTVFLALGGMSARIGIEFAKGGNVIGGVVVMLTTVIAYLISYRVRLNLGLVAMFGTWAAVIAVMFAVWLLSGRNGHQETFMVSLGLWVHIGLVGIIVMGSRPLQP